MAESLGTAVLHLAVNSTGLVSGLSKAKGKTAAAMASMSAVGGKMTKSLTLPLLAVGAASIHFAREFDGSMRKVQTLVGVSSKQVEEWKNDILKMSKEVGKSPKELADGLFFVTSAGFRGAQALDVLRTSAKASKIGLGETKVVADLLTSAINSYGKENLTASQAADTLTGMVRAGKAEATDFAPVLGSILPLAAELGVGFNEVGGSLAQMTRLGVPASRAATNLQAIMSGLLRPTEGAKTALSGVGLSAEGLRAQLADKGVISVLQTLETAFQGNVAKMAEVFPNVRALRGVLALVGKSGESTANVFKQVRDSTGAMDEGFKVVSQSSGFKMDQAISSLQVSAIRIGRVLLPIAASVATFLGGIADGFSGLSGPVQKFIVIFALVAAVVGPALIAIVRIASALMALRVAFVAMSTAAGLAAGPFGVFIGVAMAVGAAIGFFANQNRNAASAAQQAAAAMRDQKAAMDELKGSNLGLSQAQLNLKAAHLEVRSAAQGLDDVQRQVNSGQLKGRTGAIALSQAELRVKQAHLGVKTAAQQVTQAHKATADGRTKVSAATIKGVDAARKEVAQAKLGVAIFGRSTANVTRLRSAKQALAQILKTVAKNSNEMNSKIRQGPPQLDRLKGAEKGAGEAAAGAGGKVQGLGAKAQAAGGKAAAAAGRVADLARAIANLPSTKTININVNTNRTETLKRVTKDQDEVGKKTQELSGKHGQNAMKSMAKGAKKTAPQVKQVITETVEQAIAEAKRALTSMGQNIASTLGSAIDEATQRKIDFSNLSSPEAVRLRTLQQAMDADETAHQRTELQKRINTAETAEERAEAIRELNRFETQEEMDRLSAQLQLQEQYYTTDADNRKQALERGLADLTDMLNRGAITQAEFAQRATELIEAQAPEYHRVGSLLGDAAGRGFTDAWKALLTQAGLVNAFGPTAGSGADLGFSDPRRAAKTELLELLNSLTGRATSESSPGGKKITAAEQQGINAVRARIKALGIAKGGIVGGPGGVDRAGLFRLTRGEGVFRTSAMEGMQKFFEGGGQGSRPIVVNFHGPVIGGGDRRSLGRELASIIEPELSRRVALR